MESKIHRDIYTAELYCDGIAITVGDMTALSLNEYKKMHFSRISKTKQSYRSVLDVILMSLNLSKSSYAMDEHGIRLVVPLFISARVAWGIGFKVERSRDLGNYTQKILQDALVSANFFKDDNYKVIHEDKVFFMEEKKDQIKVFIEGEVDPSYTSHFIGQSIAGEVERYKLKFITPDQEDDGEY